MFSDEVLPILGGAAGVGGLLTPVLVHLAGRRQSLTVERQALVDELQHERDLLIARGETRDATIAALWDYVLSLRYWLVKGEPAEPPTMPDTLTINAVRSRLTADR